VAVQSTRTFDTYVEGLNDVLKSFKRLDKEATKELRVASRAIAEKHMVPAWKNAALNYAGPWGEAIAATVRTGSDRIPYVKIGANKKTLSGGASPTMVRYGSDKGSQGRAGSKMPPAFGQGTDWMSKVKQYQGPVLQEWAEAVDRIVRKWDNL
jgi:hypothetical protein